MILCAGCAYGRRWHLAAGYTLGLGQERPIRYAGLARHAAIGLRLLPGQGLEVVGTQEPDQRAAAAVVSGFPGDDHDLAVHRLVRVTPLLRFRGCGDRATASWLRAVDAFG